MDDYKIISLPAFREPAPSHLQPGPGDLTVRGISIDPFLLIKKKKSQVGENLEHTIEPKTPKKRTITTNQRWKFSPHQLDPTQQLEYVRQIAGDRITDEAPCHFINRQIQQKLGGYRSQDTKKGKLDADKFINREQVLHLMLEVENLCFYCKEKVHVLYENVREPRQWTLERMDNDYGHNSDNVTIACLECNLRRRNMHHERYLFTKQLSVGKVGENLSPH
jgi:hypothetical protein